MADIINNNPNTDPLPSVAISDASGSITSDASNGVFVAPFIATMCADASGTVGVLQQVTVSIFDIDETFDYSITDNAVCRNILKAFAVTDVSDGSGANVQVDMSGDAKVDFHAELTNILLSDDLSNGSVSLKGWLKNETQADVTKMLSYDTLADLLEANTLQTFAIDLDASGGANDLYEVMDDDGAAAARRTLFTQLTESRVEAYAIPSDGSGNSWENTNKLNFLPLVAGDKLVFVFDVTVGQYSGSNTVPTNGAPISRIQIDNGSADNTLSLNGGYTTSTVSSSIFNNGSLVIYAPTKRRVAVRLEFTGSELTPGDAFANTKDPATMTISLD